MQLFFNQEGYLTPNSNILTNWDNFYDTFSFNEYRKKQLGILEDYLNNFSNKITPDFRIWIDGSFVTKKQRPHDIDFVIFIDYQIMESSEDLVKDFLNLGIFVPRELDAYIVETYPEEHQNYKYFEEREKYWLFEFTRVNPKNRLKKQVSKGFIEIDFESDGKRNRS